MANDLSGTAVGLSNAIAHHYRIERELGAGGMATVYLAEDIKHRRRVAVKVLHADLAASLGAERFLREIRIAARLQHPHIVGLLDSGDADGVLYYVMPYVEGETLRSRLDRERRLADVDAARILADIADALAYAHERGVVHRDIKPENVMLSGRHALVTDFGIARALAAGTAEHGGTSRHTTVGVTLGTPGYMSPEQATADPAVDHRTDIYALGVIGYELLAGEPPFRGPPQQVLMGHVTQDPTPLSRLRPDIAPDLCGAIMRCLRKRPDDRWPSASALGSALEATIAESGGHKAAQSGAGRTPQGRRRARIGVFVSAAAVLAAAGALFVRLVVPPRRLMVVSTAQITSDAGLYLDPSLSPDGKLLAYASGPPSAMRIFVQQLDGGRSMPLVPDDSADQRWPQWSPDGQRIVFASDSGVEIVPALGGRPRRVATPPNGIPASPTWSPDGRRIAYGDASGVELLDVATGATTRIASTPNSRSGRSVPEQYFDLRWSPDGRWIAASSGNVDFAFAKSDLGNVLGSALVLLAADGSKRVVLPSDSSALEISPVWLPDSRHLLFVSSRGGGRDVYEVGVTREGDFQGVPTRLTTGIQAHSISMAADGRALVYSSYTPSAGVWTIALSPTKTVSSRDAVPLTHGTDIIEETVLSPDHRSLLVTSNRSGQSNLFVLPVTGGTAVQLTFDTTDIFEPTWSGTGQEVVFRRTGPNAGLYTMPAAGGPATAIPHSSTYERPDWSPTADVLLFADIGDPRQPLETIRRTHGIWSAPQVVRGTSQAGYPAWSPDGRWIAYLTRTRTAGSAGDMTLAVIPDSGGQPRPLVRASGDIVALDRPIWDESSQAVYYRAVDSRGRVSLWMVGIAGAPARELVTFDDPDRPGVLRPHYAILNGRMYTRIMQHRSVLGIAQLARH